MKALTALPAHATALLALLMSAHGQGGGPLVALADVDTRLGEGTVTLVSRGGGAPLSFPTIQAAVDAALEGDEVVLSDGLFVGAGNTDVYVSGKNMAIRSQNGPSRCVINGQNRSRGFLFDGPDVTSETLLYGITIVSGMAGPGTSVRGGGISCENGSSPTIDSCVVTACEAGLGGGIYYLPIRGGGGSGVIRNTQITNNFASIAGGGILASGALIDRCEVSSNTSAFWSGGLHASFPGGTIRDSVIARNQALGGRGGAMIVEGTYEFQNCTIVYNASLGAGGGIAFTEVFDPTSTISNTILWGNVALGDGGQQVFHPALFGFDAATFSHCDIQGGKSGFLSTGFAPPVLVEVVNADPLFADPASGDYTLQPSSPCVDAGDPLFVADVNEGDWENQPRANGTVDVGADEHWPGVGLTLPSPARAGEVNCSVVTGARPGAFAFFFYGAGVGTTFMGFGACPTLELDIEGAAFLGARRVGLAGRASYSQFVPAELSGVAVVLQAVVFDVDDVSQGCDVSNVASCSYP